MIIAICEDEIEFQKVLIRELEDYYGKLEVEIQGFLSGEEFLKKFNRTDQEYRIIFMDIEMSGLDGVETAKRIREINHSVPIIFLTSHIEMAMEGYEVDAFRFLEKPIKQEKLINALRDVDKLRQLDYKIELHDGEKSILINWCEIEYVQSENVYIHVVLGQNKYLIRKKLSELEEAMPKQIFYKPHRSYLINLGLVQAFDGKKINMQCGREIPISRGKGSEFKTRMMKYLSTLG